MFSKDWHNDNKIRNKNIPHSFPNKPADVPAHNLLYSYDKSSFFRCFITITSTVATTQEPIFSHLLLNADGKAVFYKHFPIISLGLDETHTGEHLKVQHFLQDLQRVPTWKLSLQGTAYLKHRFPWIPAGSHKYILLKTSALHKSTAFTFAYKVLQVPQCWW